MDRRNTDDQISFESTAKLFNSLGMNKENSIAIENLTKKIAKLDIIPESEDIEGQIRVASIFFLINKVLIIIKVNPQRHSIILPKL